jgi:anthranilate phosphoribosyltransferase
MEENDMIQEVLQKVMSRQNLERDEARTVMNALMSGEFNDAQIAAFLIAMRMKGETAAEVAGFAEAMRSKATPVKTRHADAIDVCGTGGDGKHTYNISTIVSFVVAGAGVPVAKHGNRSVSSNCGSADVLAELGVNINLNAEQMGTCLDEIGIAFLFAPALHGAMKFAAPARKALGLKTVFNILGPMTNPAGVKRQFTGVFDRNLPMLMATVLRELGTTRALIVHGEDGLDEVTLHDRTYAVELKYGEIRELLLSPEDFKMRRVEGSIRSDGDVKKNAEMVLQVLDGKASLVRDTVLVNAACALMVAEKVKTLREGMHAARHSIDSGAALDKLNRLRSFSQSVASKPAHS